MKLEISSDELVRRVMYRLHLRHLRSELRRQELFWPDVAAEFSIGCTSACALCEWAGYDMNTAKKLEAK